MPSHNIRKPRVVRYLGGTLTFDLKCRALKPSGLRGDWQKRSVTIDFFSYYALPMPDSTLMHELSALPLSQPHQYFRGQGGARIAGDQATLSTIAENGTTITTILGRPSVSMAKVLGYFQTGVDGQKPAKPNARWIHSRIFQSCVVHCDDTKSVCPFGRNDATESSFCQRSSRLHDQMPPPPKAQHATIGTHVA